MRATLSTFAALFVAPIAPWIRLSPRASSNATALHETVLYLSDSQIGFSRNRAKDAAQLSAVAAIASREEVGHVVLAGDLVDSDHVWNNGKDLREYQQAAKGFAPSKVHVVPGNHDFWNPKPSSAAGQLQQMARYTRLFGPLHSSFRTRFARFVLIDSETIENARTLRAELSPQLAGTHGREAAAAAMDGRGVENETVASHLLAVNVEAQWDFIAAALRQAQNEKLHPILVMHRPPFLVSERRDAPFWFWHPPMRQRLFSLARSFGARLFLCGHVHTTANAVTEDGSIHVLSLSGTSVAFDNRGCGYRRLTITAQAVDVEYNELTTVDGKRACGRSWAGWLRSLMNNNDTQSSSLALHIERRVPSSVAAAQASRAVHLAGGAMVRRTAPRRRDDSGPTEDVRPLVTANTAGQLQQAARVTARCHRAPYLTSPRHAGGSQVFEAANARIAPCVWDAPAFRCTSIAVTTDTTVQQAWAACSAKGLVQPSGAIINFSSGVSSDGEGESSETGEQGGWADLPGASGLLSLARPANVSRVAVLYSRWGFNSPYTDGGHFFLSRLL